MKKLTAREQLLLCKEYALGYSRIAKFPHLPPEEISEYQFTKIKQLLDVSYHHTSFYRRLYSGLDIHPEDVKTWADFEHLPTVTKDDILADHPGCIVDAKAGRRNLRITRSSGSSGRILNIPTDTSFWIQTTLLMLRMFQGSFRITPFTRGALIYTSEYPFRSALGLYGVKYLRTLAPVAELIAELRKLQPEFITAYPSILLELITEFPNECKDLSAKAISTNSEQSTDQQRELISAAFNAPVFDEYSTEELGFGGFQCNNGRYHLQERGAYFEILDPATPRQAVQGEVGEIVGTCLINGVMPFIRYRQGDLGSIVPSDCTCGDNGRVLGDISGRKNSSFKLSSGRIIPSGRILDWSYKLILDLRAPIAQFQVTQQTLDDVEVAIVRSDSVTSLDVQMLQNSFRDTFGESLSIRVEQVDEISRTPVGKHIPIRSLVE